MKKAVPTRTFASFRPTVEWSSHAQEAVARGLIVLVGLCIALSGCASAVIQPPPEPGAAPVAPPPAPYNGPTIPKLLGIPECAAATKECAQKVCTCLKRQFPGPGAGAPNLGEVGPKSAPAVKCAAEIIAAEEEAPQKIDALRYLGKVGCTKCYPCVEEGLLAALDDCTESVRYEAAKAIRATASEPCKCCQCTRCCTPKIYEKLSKVAYETDGRGCPVECSSRVRRVARQALCLCGGPSDSIEDELEPTPSEGPSGAPPADTTAAAGTPTTPTTTAAVQTPAGAPVSSSPAGEQKTASVASETASPEKKESTAPAAMADEHKSAAPTARVDDKSAAIMSRPTLRLATAPAIESSPTTRPVSGELSNANSPIATECEACGTKDSASGRAPNPFR